MITLSLEKEIIVSEKIVEKVLNLFPAICAKHLTVVKKRISHGF